MIQVICCSSLLSVPGRAGAFSRDNFTTGLAPECRAFSGALKIEKLKAPLIPGPEGVVDTNERCIIRLYQMVKPEFLPPLLLNLNVFHIIIADQSVILLFLEVLFFWQLCLPCFSIKTVYKHKYKCNDPLSWIFIGQMSASQ